MTTPTTIFKFYYKDHLVRGLVKDGKGYLLGPDVMTLLGYRRPLANLNWLLKGDRHAKEFIHDVPVISLWGVAYLTEFSRKEKKAKNFYDWVADQVKPILDGCANLPDEVRTESWKKEDFKKYLSEAEASEDTGVRSLDPKKITINCPIGGKTAVKVKIDTSLCTVQEALKEIVMAVIAKENRTVDCISASKTLSQLSENVMAEVQNIIIYGLEAC